MAHLSKKELPSETVATIHRQLLSLFSSHNRNVAKVVTEEFLTETERLMLAKRLAIVMMLNEEISYYRISRTLAVSTSTIKRLHTELLNENFSATLKLANNKKGRENFWKALETILQAGMPPRGKGRWGFLNKIK